MATYIARHGVKGQKWGVRRYQNKDGTRTAAGKKHAEESKTRKGLSDNQKRAIKIGAAVTATALVAVGGVYLYKTHKLDGLINIGKSSLSTADILGLDDKMVANNKPDLTEKYLHEAATNINPSGSSTNCGSVSSAVIHNIKTGNKVIALDSVPEHMREPGKKGYDPKKLIECYENAKWIPKSGMNRKALSDSIEQEILSYGDGATGLLYTDGFAHDKAGHYFAWANVKNKVHIIEGQPPGAKSEGIVWNKNLYDDVIHIFDPNANVALTRLDNCNIVKGREKDLFKNA